MDPVDVARPRIVVIVTYQDVQALDVAGPHEVFDGATELLAAPAASDAGYAPVLASLTPGMVRSESGLTVVAEALADVGERRHAAGPGRWRRVRRRRRRSAGGDRRRAGRALPARRRCLQRRLPARRGGAARRPAGRRRTGPERGAWLAEHPTVDVDADPIWIRDGDVWTSAGVTAGIDLALALVEDDLGIEIAESVARWLVMFLRRPGGQSQFAAPVWLARAQAAPSGGPRT